MLVGITFLLTLLFLALLFTVLGNANQDLGHVEWSFEWLFTFPVCARALLAGKSLEYAFVGALSWLTAFPLLIAVAWQVGFRYSSPLIAAALTIYLNVLVGSARLVIETWVRKRFAPSRLKNLQALFTVSGVLCLFALILIVMTKSSPASLGAVANALPDAVCWLPSGLPALVFSSSAPVSFVAIAACALVAALAFAAGIGIAARIVRDGLSKGGRGAYRGVRGRSVRGDRLERGHRQGLTPGLTRGILAKELLLLRRDRNFMVQTILVPFMVVAFQVILNPALASSDGDFRHGAVLAFGVGVYALGFGSFSIVSREAPALWLIYSFPESIVAILQRKVRIWATTGIVFALGVLLFAILGAPGIDRDTILHSLMALAGVLVFARIGCGLGLLGTNALEVEPQRRVRHGMFYLYLSLAGLYGIGIYAPSLWSRLALIVLFALLAYAIWQKAADHAPYLLDPTERPPPRIGLSDGLIAALAFAVLQGIVVLIFVANRIGGSATSVTPALWMLTVAFTIAGALVVAGMTLAFRLARVPELRLSLGLARSAESSTLPLAILRGINAGAIAAIAAIGYVALLERIPQFDEMLRSTRERSLSPGDGLWLLLIAVVLAPIFEEFIFRGLVFRGMLRTQSLWTSILASAAIFAIIHPPISVAPVFVLGTAAAWSFARTKLLITPIVAHAVYNAVVVGYELASGP